MTDPKTLDEALAALQADPPMLVKDKSGQAGNQKTLYADLVQVNKVVLAKLSELGVIYVCAPTLQDDGKFVLAYELLHVASSTRRAGNYPLKLSENSQHMGSAISYARRYVLLSLTGVAAEDDDDDGYAQNARPTAQRAPRAQAAQRPVGGQGATAQRSRAGAPPLPGEPEMISREQQSMMFGLFSKTDMSDKDSMLGFIEQQIGRRVESRGELTKADARKVIDALLDMAPAEVAS